MIYKNQKREWKNLFALISDHLPHDPWSLIGVTAPFCLQSIEGLTSVTFPYLKDVAFKKVCSTSEDCIL